MLLEGGELTVAFTRLDANALMFWSPSVSCLGIIPHWLWPAPAERRGISSPCGWRSPRVSVFQTRRRTRKKRCETTPLKVNCVDKSDSREHMVCPRSFVFKLWVPTVRRDSTLVGATVTKVSQTRLVLLGQVTDMSVGSGSSVRACRPAQRGPVAPACALTHHLYSHQGWCYKPSGRIRLAAKPFLGNRRLA